MEDFYRELDTRVGRSCFNFTTLIIFLIVLFVLGSVGAIWLVQKVKQGGVPRTILPSQQAKESINRKIEEIVKQGEASNEASFTLTEEELTTLLADNLSKTELGKRFREPEVELDPPFAVIHATLVDPVRSQTRWWIEPVVSKGKLIATITKIEVGKLTIPESIAGQFQADVNEIIAGFVPLAGRFEPTSVQVRRDALVITGKIK